MEELRKLKGDHPAMIALLKDHISSEKSNINDPVKIRSVDLMQYDQLSSREV